MDLNQDYKHDVEVRLRGIVWLVGLFFVLIVARLFYLQIFKGNYYSEFSAHNSIKDVLIQAPRGIMRDRNGVILADNRAVFDLVVIPQYITDKDKLSATIAGLLNVEKAEILDLLVDAAKQAQYKPFVIKEDVPMDIVSGVMARRQPFGAQVDYNIDGLDVEVRYLRNYADPLAVTHLLGYVREIDQAKIDKLNEKERGKYKQGDYIGVTGLEEAFDANLRGEEGLEQKIVDALGREVSYTDLNIDLTNQPIKAGDELFLTVDLALQQKAKELLKDQIGALVALNPSSGAVLAIYSSPSYDLARVTSGDRNKYWAELSVAEDKPLYNRAIQGLYPPASTYKMMTAIAGLEEKETNTGLKTYCGGGMRFGDRTFACWKGGGHGTVDIINAISQSCDVFFYNLGLKLGIDRLAVYSKKFGFGATTGIEIPGEKKGLIPDTDWKFKVYGNKWRESETLSAAIGQGYNLVTPLQVAVMGAEIANGGYRVQPFIVREIKDSAGNLIFSHSASKIKIMGISPENLDIVRQGMINVTEGEGGTAGSLRRFGLKIAGKTGTAQVVSRENASRLVEKRTHSWFVGYAPYDDPKIAVAAIIEHGGHGSSVAAPIVAELMKTYLSHIPSP